MYSASVIERKIARCFVFVHMTGASLIRNIYLMVDLLFSESLPKSESTYLTSCMGTSWLRLIYFIPHVKVSFKYLTIFFTACQ